MPDRCYRDAAQEAVEVVLSGPVDPGLATSSLRDIINGVVSEHGSEGPAALSVVLIGYLARAFESLADAQGRPVYEVHREFFAESQGPTDVGEEPGT